MRVLPVGGAIGENVGSSDGTATGDNVGSKEGSLDGLACGWRVGSNVDVVGSIVGLAL